MLLYEVSYPGSVSFDKDIPWDYLRRLAADPKNNGAVARCVNGERATYVLVKGEWVEKKD